jgi:DNA-binding MarR family transcriptional regulator
MGRTNVNGERQVAELALQLGRAAYGDTTADGLTPAQWMALRYFARANRFSRTVSAFAEFHATTRGTASQTVKSLAERGYLTRVRSERDGRSATFSLTERARRRLADDPFEAVVKAALALSPTQRNRTASGLRRILRQLAAERERPAMGVCALCGHLGSTAGRNFQCRLLHESLAPPELEQICSRFEDCSRSDSAGDRDSCRAASSPNDAGTAKARARRFERSQGRRSAI